jgi:hypothetical protein
MTDEYPPLLFKQALLRAAVGAPSGAMALLAYEIERELRLMLAATGQLHQYQGVPIQALNLLSKTVGEFALPESLRSSVKSFYHLKHDLDHGGQPEQLIVDAAVDFGIAVLKVLHGIPRWSYVVLHNAVPIFSDLEGKNQRLDVRGVILWKISPNGQDTHPQIFPTRKHYFAGTKVSWEWDRQGPGWGESWYRDPMKRSIEFAWSGSLEFIGRPLDEI